MKDSSAPAEEHPVAAPWVGPGAMLREARESKRMSIRAVADALHLSTDIIEGLEQERFDDLPPLTFVKGYLRAYGKLVDLPEERLMESFARLGLDQSEPLPDINASPELPGRGASAGAWILLAIVIVLAAGLGYWWYGQRADTGVSAPPQTDERPEPGQSQRDTRPSAADGVAGTAGNVAATSPYGDGGPADAAAAGTSSPASDDTTGSSDEDLPSAGERADTAPVESRSGAEEEQAGTVTEDPAGDKAPSTVARSGEDGGAGGSAGGPEASASPSARTDAARSATGAQAGASTTATITLNVTGESWVDVRDATGARVLYGLISGPAQRTVSGEPPFTLVIGEARVVELSYEGKPVGLEPYTRGDVARFQWPPDS